MEQTKTDPGRKKEKTSSQMWHIFCMSAFSVSLQFCLYF